MSQATPRHRLPYIIAGQAQKELTHNEALALIDAVANASAVSIGLNTPPAAPVSGQCWITGSAPEGVWTGQAQALACWTEGGWRFVAPRPGMHVWVEDQQLRAVRDDSSWKVGDVRGQTFSVSGQQVVGARGAAVQTPSGGAVQDLEARTALSNLIARLVAHGLIEA